MAFDYKIIPLPPLWPAKETAYRRPPPFKPRTNWVRYIAREVKMLNGSNVTIAVDVEERHINQAGTLYSNARPRSPKVILSFDTKDGRLQFPADRFATWLANVDAIARVMEDLRRAERYGVRAGAQYTGFKALPAETTATLSTQHAAEIIARHAGQANAAAILSGSVVARDAIRRASANTHPDRGGSSDLFSLVMQAKAALERHFGPQS